MMIFSQHITTYFCHLRLFFCYGQIFNIQFLDSLLQKKFILSERFDTFLHLYRKTPQTMPTFLQHIAICFCRLRLLFCCGWGFSFQFLILVADFFDFALDEFCRSIGFLIGSPTTTFCQRRFINFKTLSFHPLKIPDADQRSPRLARASHNRNNKI
jgi:hypothetical protein